MSKERRNYRPNRNITRLSRYSRSSSFYLKIRVRDKILASLFLRFPVFLGKIRAFYFS